MKNKKGFTLVEIIAIVILLGLIALIISPRIMETIENQKLKIFTESVESLIKIVEKDVINNTSITSSANTYREYKFNGGELTLIQDDEVATDENIPISGNIQNGSGYVSLNTDNTISLAISNGEYCATKNADETSIVVVKSSSECINSEIDLTEAPSCYLYEEKEDNTIIITGYDYENPSCSKDLVIPNRINGKYVSELAPFAFIKNSEYDTWIGEYIDDEGNKYQEFIPNLPLNKEIVELSLTSLSNIDSKYCTTDDDNYIDVGIDYIHTDNDGYIDCGLGLIDYNLLERDINDFNEYIFSSIDFSRATKLNKIPIGLIMGASLTNVKFGNYIEEIGSHAFAGNYIFSVDLPNSLIEIGSSGFVENVIENIDFSRAKSLKYIRAGAFAFNNFNNIDLSNMPQLVSIDGGGYGAFESNDVSSLTISNNPNLVNIGSLKDAYSPFWNCDIKNISLSILPSLKVIGNYAFSGTLYQSIDLTSFSNLESIGYIAFNINLTGSTLTIPNNVTFVGSFYRKGLTFKYQKGTNPVPSQLDQCAGITEDDDYYYIDSSTC